METMFLIPEVSLQANIDIRRGEAGLAFALPGRISQEVNL